MRTALTDPTPHDGRPPPNARSPTRAAGTRSISGDLDEPLLATKVRLVDGRIHDGAIPSDRHRRLHLGLLHGRERRLRRDRGRAAPAGRQAADHHSQRTPATSCPAARAGNRAGWRRCSRSSTATTAPETRSASRRPCAGSAPPPRHMSRTPTGCGSTSTDRDGLPVVRRLLRHKAAHLVLESAGSGGVHCYWRLRTPLRLARKRPGRERRARRLSHPPRRQDETIEHAHERLIYALGYEWRDGRPVPTIADQACKDRSRVMRLAGTVNGKTGRYARDHLGGPRAAAVVATRSIGDLPDPPKPRARPQARGRAS